ncbi:hypothetical protein BDV93DRAFT_562709 [Ceratobasidium sp. AG-I]|nr:hypothetical protein BDV93DRAFT_562709 [Ceratobasidium sp. AG-I]
MTTPDFDEKLLDRLFPAPSFSSAFTSKSAPTPNAGTTPESTETLRKLLKENHRRFHIFFNEKGFHNHLSHHLFAAYSLGAPPSILQAAFDEHASYQRPAFKSPEPVTRSNWTKFLGNENFYHSYMNFFNDEIEANGLDATVQYFIFSHDANWAGEEPRMLDRFLAGLLHPMIHFGHAAEFGVPGMAVEGLAQAAVHKSSYSELWSAKFFDHPFDPPGSSGYLSSLTAALSLSPKSSTIKPKPHTHALTILSRVLADSRLGAGNTCRFESESKFTDTLKGAGEILREYAELWTVGSGKEEIQERVEELQWFVAVLFGLGGWKKDRAFRADFFLVHLVTSDLFIPSILSLLKPPQQANLLKAYFAVALGYFVSRGRPSIDVKGFFENTSADPKPPSDSSSTNDQAGNPWYTVLSATLPHKDEHHVKAERALAHGAALYGTRPRGFFKNTELEDAEYLDGTLFVRVGGLLMGALKWENALVPGGIGKPVRDDDDDDEFGWDRAGLGWD